MNLLNEPIGIGKVIIAAVTWLVLFTKWTPEQKGGAITLGIAVAGWAERRAVTPGRLIEKRLAENRHPLTGEPAGGEPVS